MYVAPRRSRRCQKTNCSSLAISLSLSLFLSLSLSLSLPPPPLSLSLDLIRRGDYYTLFGHDERDTPGARCHTWVQRTRATYTYTGIRTIISGSPAAAAAAGAGASALSTCCPQADRAADTGLAPDVRPFPMRATTSFSCRSFFKTADRQGAHDTFANRPIRKRTWHFVFLKTVLLSI